MSEATLLWLIETAFSVVKAVQTAIAERELSEEQQMRLAELAFEASSLKKWGPPSGG